MHALRLARWNTVYGAASEPYQRVLDANGRTFAFAARFLPARVRPAISVLYAFCRLLDDLIDEGGPAEHRLVGAWRAWLLGDCGAPDAALAAQLEPLLEQVEGLRPVLVELAEALLADASPRCLRSEEELDAYCRGVAGTVGEGMALLLGVREAPALAAADALGRAMQRTNVLRDIAEDLRRGRCYIPRETLAAFGLSTSDLSPGAMRGVRRAAFEALLASEAGKARRLYARGLRGIAYVPRDCRVGITAAAYGYRAILDRIEQLGARVLEQRATTSTLTKVRCAVRAWCDLNLGGFL